MLMLKIVFVVSGLSGGVKRSMCRSAEMRMWTGVW